MSQAIFDKLQPNQKTQVKYIYFQNSNSEPSLSGFTLNVYNAHPTYGNLQGSLSLAQFPNLRKIQFVNNFSIANLEEIDISENIKLNRVIISTDGNGNPLQNASYSPLSCSLLAKEKQLNQVIVTYSRQILHNNNTSMRWTEISKLLKKQSAIPVFLIEDQKAEQQEAEIKTLKQQIQEKDQQITNLTKQTEQTPTFKQFQELNEIALPSSELNFDLLKKEIKRLKLKDFIPYYKKQKDDFERLVANAKNKTKEGLGTILDLLLQTQSQIIESEKTEDSFAKGQLQGQLTTCQTLLQTNLSKEELKNLLNKKNEQLKLEQQWASLQGNNEKTHFDEKETESSEEEK
ncbi:3752_t:CDS:1 [Funneliformis mosseae]|uniref:3752_t:CDS:1 n=1 Tax=Funneliformis mosseae TaxID=27381 RepID=A0A9N8WE43_FUNMO|nr:3752_t:CDS:1 [Funneliformis mosseae]